MNTNSTENQTIKGEYINKEVFANVTSTTEYILNKSNEDSNTPFPWDAVENYYIDN